MGFIVALYLVVHLLVNNSVKEGITFTPYDNAKFFTKPWDAFCVTQPPSCNNNMPLKQGMIGDAPIGCNCDGIGEPIKPLRYNCNSVDFSHFYK